MLYGRQTPAPYDGRFRAHLDPDTMREQTT